MLYVVLVFVILQILFFWQGSQVVLIFSHNTDYYKWIYILLEYTKVKLS